MLVQVDDTLGNGEIVGGRDLIQELENEFQDLKKKNPSQLMSANNGADR